MVWTTPSKPTMDVRAMVDRIIASGQMSRKEHLQLTSVILATDKITGDERRLLNRVFDSIQAGRLKLVN
ncbi:hypothetical protein IQ268_20020 [Oculatella sp. LEGE 06141]|uniref:hypothetical protein n=1 Tax=Oculatella sp. LEGE 06141 TaxID=1828648 RepID=UPI001882B2B6|nr:hypothetical protein [Oculatella sp. LEGE 06141]MBE9180852.1 hypothetical protein [Oculatella sp. LEGE 06141]